MLKMHFISQEPDDADGVPQYSYNGFGVEIHLLDLQLFDFSYR
jgi:hypothetical protein